MKLYRYYCRSSTGRTFGVICGGHDYERVMRHYGLTSWTEALSLQDKVLGWLDDPEMSGEYWFTEEGNRRFKEEALDYIVCRLPRQPAKALCRHVLDLAELPGWEEMVVYQDQHQVVFQPSNL